MLYTLNINPNSVVELKASSKTQTENTGIGFFENIREILAKENQLQVANKEAACQVDFLKPKSDEYANLETEEEETADELVAKIRNLLKQFK